MPPTTFLGLLVLALTIAPGALYTWAFERQAGSFGVAFADRILRFIAVSLVFQVALGWPEFFILHHVRTSDPRSVDAASFAVLWSAAIVYTSTPVLIGTVVGGLWASRIGREGWPRIRRRLSESSELTLLQLLVGRSPAPRAWDALFSLRPTVFRPLQLVDGSWVAGAFDDSSYAAGFPNEPDLLLTPAWSLDADQNLVAQLPTSLYVPAGQIRMMEILNPEPSGGAHG